MTSARDHSLFEAEASRSLSAPADEGRTLDYPKQQSRRLIRCPGCQNISPVPDNYFGQFIRCRKCQERFRLDFSPETPNDASERATLIEGERPGSPAAAPAAPPDLIGRFQVLDKLGRGQFGTVFRAYDPQLDREVALKVPRPETLDSLKRVDRFLRESRAAARLRHPHIVAVFDAGHDGNHYYIAQAFIQGHTLAEVIDQRRLGDRQLAQIVRQLADALAYAHGLGIVHRDVKPANIMVDESDQPHLMDFGLAYRLEAPDKPETASAGSPPDSKLTQDGGMVGTPAYMAPEQAGGQGQVASDQYSLGIVLYELLTGQTPFAGPPKVVQFNHLHTPPTPPRQLRREVPRDLEAICLKALAKQPADRYPSCRDLAEDLRRWLDGEAVQARPPRLPERVARWCRREPRLALASAVTLGSLVAVAMISAGNAVQKDMLLGNVEQARQQEKQARGQAEERQHQAEQARREAEEQGRKADRARAEAVSSKTELEQRLYFNLIALADRELRDRNVARAQELLDRCPKTLRQWEWRYLNRQSHREQLHLGGHAGAINSVAFSPDGQRFASANQDETISIWSIDRRRPPLRLQGHTGSVRCVAFSPDGLLLASASSDKTVKLWDTTTGRETRTWHGHGAEVRCLAFSSTGKRLASGSLDETVRLWDIDLPHALFVVRAHGKGVTSVSFSPDGRVLATAGQDHFVRVWDATAGRAIEAFPGYSGGAFGPDGRAALIREDGTVMVFPADPRQGAPLALGRSTGEVHTIAFSPSGRQLATAGEDGVVRVWDSQQPGEPMLLRGHEQGVTGVVFSPDGKYLASASRDRTVRLWELATATSVVYSSEGKRLQEVRAPQALTLAEYANHVHGVAFSPDGARLATAASVYDRDRAGFVGAEVKIWDALTSREISTLSGITPRVWCLTFSPDGQWLALGSKDQSVQVWSIQSGRPVLTFDDHTGSVNSVTFSPDGQRLATAGDDRVIRIYDLKEKKLALKLPWHTGPVMQVAFSPDGARLASAGGDHQAGLWDARHGMLLAPLRGHAGGVNAVTFRADGQGLATASSDATVMLWDRDGKPLATLTGHSRHVLGLAFSPDGKRLASTSADKTVKMWDVASQQEALSLRGNVGFGFSVAFSPNGQRLASASGDGAKVWDASGLTRGDDLASLVAGLRDADPAVRGAARRDLVEMGGLAAPLLLKSLDQPELRAEAALVLGSIRPPVEDAIPRLIAALTEEDPLYRIAIQEALARLGRPAVPALAETLKDVRPRVLAAALVVLGRIGPEAQAALPGLIRLLDNVDPKLRAAAVHALADIDPLDADALRACTQALTDASEDVRTAAHLAQLRAGKPALPRLARLLRDGPAAARREAAQLIGKIGIDLDEPETAATLPALLACLTDDDSSIRPIVEELLASLHPKLRDAIPDLRQVLRQPRPKRPARALGEVRYVPVARLTEASSQPEQLQLLDILRELAERRHGPQVIAALALAASRDTEFQGEAAALLLRHLSEASPPRPKLPTAFRVNSVAVFIKENKLEAARKNFDDLLDQFPDFSRTRDAEHLRELFAQKE